MVKDVGSGWSEVALMKRKSDTIDALRDIVLLIAGRIGAEERERRRVVRCVVLAVVCVMEVVLVVWKMNKIQEQATHLTTTPAQLCKAQQAGLLRVVCVCADGVI